MSPNESDNFFHLNQARSVTDGVLQVATLAASAGLDRRIAPFVALYVLLLAITGPLLTVRSRSLARLLPARLFPPVPARPPVAPISRPEQAP